MNRSISRGMAVGLLAAGTLLSGCVYRMNIQQGNYLEGRTVDQLQVGMTRSQVRFLLGTPMVPGRIQQRALGLLVLLQERPPETPRRAARDRVVQGGKGGQVREEQRPRVAADGAGRGCADREVPEDLAEVYPPLRPPVASYAFRDGVGGGRFGAACRSQCGRRRPARRTVLAAHRRFPPARRPRALLVDPGASRVVRVAAAKPRATSSASAMVALSGRSTVQRY